jgi:hypothetical protein
MAVATGIPEGAQRFLNGRAKALKQSGHGREKDGYALELYTGVKTVVANLGD